MPYDLKYGQVTLENQRRIGDDEPVFVFRAQDALLPQVLKFYHDLCSASGSPKAHLSGITEAYSKVMEWQQVHPYKVPTSSPMPDEDDR